MTEPVAPLDGRAEPPSPFAARAILAAALLLSLVFAFWELDFPLQGSEGRWAMVSREMAASHNLFSMTIAGRPYDDKPFGSYWLILLASKLTGSMSEFTLRLPSVISYVMTVLLVYAIGRRTAGSPGTAALAAFIYATMLRILYFSREASADAQTVLGIAAALLLVLEAGEKPRGFLFPLIGLVMGLSSLMKGLTGFAVPCFAAFLWCVLVRGFRWLRPVPVLLGIAVFAAMLGGPLLVAHARQGGWHPADKLWSESVGRAVSPFDHREAWYFYLWNQFEFLSPWSAFLPAAIGLGIARVRARAARRGGYALWMFDREEDRRRLFPFFCYAAIFLFFTLSGSRRTYYLMPVAPFASVALAQALIEDLPRWALRFKRVLFWAFAVAMILAGVAALFGGCLRLSMSEPPEFLNAVARLLGLEGQISPEMWRAMPPWLVLTGDGDRFRSGACPAGAAEPAGARAADVLRGGRRADDGGNARPIPRGGPVPAAVRPEGGCHRAARRVHRTDRRRRQGDGRLHGHSERALLYPPRADPDCKAAHALPDHLRARAAAGAPRGEIHRPLQAVREPVAGRGAIHEERDAAGGKSKRDE